MIDETTGDRDSMAGRYAMCRDCGHHVDLGPRVTGKVVGAVVGAALGCSTRSLSLALAGGALGAALGHSLDRSSVLWQPCAKCGGRLEILDHVIL